MKIGFLTELFPPSVGGQELRFAEIADMLAAQGHQVTVLCIRHSKRASAEERRPSGVTVLRRPTLLNYVKPLRGLLPRSPIGMIRYALAARRLTHAHEFDVLFLNQWPLFHILALSRRNRARAIVDWCEIRDSFVFKVLQSLLPRLVAFNTGVSTQVARHLRAVAHRDVMVMPSGITRSLYRSDPAASRRGLLYIGRVTGHKNLDLLIEAFEELCRRGYDEPLTIAGGGPDIDIIQRRIETSPYRSKIALLGLVSDDQKFELLAAAKLLVITSRREGFPRVVAEAMASGLPVITARYPQNGTVNVVEEFQCGLAASPIPNDLADAAQVILADWDVWSARACARAASLEWSSLVRQFEAVLSQTAAGSGDQSLSQQTQGVSCESW